MLVPVGICLWRRNRRKAGARPLQQHPYPTADHSPQSVCGEKGGGALWGSARHGTHCWWKGQATSKIASLSDISLLEHYGLRYISLRTLVTNCDVDEVYGSKFQLPFYRSFHGVREKTVNWAMETAWATTNRNSSSPWSPNVSATSPVEVPTLQPSLPAGSYTAGAWENMDVLGSGTQQLSLNPN